MNFEFELIQLQSKIEKVLKDLFFDVYSKSSIYEAMRYSLMAGGKRVRPILAMSICQALGGNITEIINFSAALECIHTYSLIHDDLPAMDNDDLRRGMPTNHVVFGEAKAILAGDGLLNFAYELMFNEIVKNNYDKRYVNTGALIAKAAGAIGMIGGQVLDMNNEGLNISLENLYTMHSMKTGALIEAACLSGVYISDNIDNLDVVKNYSTNIGIAFQIIDDILDYTGDEAKLGKKIGSDKENNKATFVSLMGIEESKRLAFEHTHKAIEYANHIDKNGFLVAFTEYLLNRQN